MLVRAFSIHCGWQPRVEEKRKNECKKPRLIIAIHAAPRLEDERESGHCWPAVLRSSHSSAIMVQFFFLLCAYCAYGGMKSQSHAETVTNSALGPPSAFLRPGQNRPDSYSFLIFLPVCTILHDMAPQVPRSRSVPRRVPSESKRAGHFQGR